MTLPRGTGPSLPNNLEHWQQSLQWQPTPAQQSQFQALYTGILRGNQQINLTRITAPSEFWEKHLWDSLSGLQPWLAPIAARPAWTMASGPKNVIDIGTGAGLPGLPVAIAQPDWTLTLLDSTQKKIRFLQELIQVMALRQVKAMSDRAEFLAHQPSHREQYDLALVRAVGSAATCAEYALPLLKLGGIAVLYRGQWSPEETAPLTKATEQLGGHLLEIHPWQTPLTQSTRHCVYLCKQTLTREQFPRPVGIPSKHPLGKHSEFTDSP